MRQVTLTPVNTPSGNVAFAEARLVLECTLIEVTTPDPEDFYDPQLKRYVLDALREADQPRRYVFGRIVHTWTRK
ncbi:MAG: hypothetical protein LUF87_02960 [Alistipes sp.]|nr:hypothetical protein [Alistipes sp.]